jgi:hypothetical protein
LDCEQQHARVISSRGVTVTDLKWRALGRTWLGAEGGVLELDHEALLKRLGADELYMTVGLSRKWKGEYWPLVHAVHVIPDYSACIDLHCL